MQNRTEVYNKQIAEKIEALRRLCHQYGMPLFIAVGTSQDDSGNYTVQCTELIPELYNYKPTKDRRFENYINVTNGFIAIPPSQASDDDKLFEEAAANV